MSAVSLLSATTRSYALGDPSFAALPDLFQVVADFRSSSVRTDEGFARILENYLKNVRNTNPQLEKHASYQESFIPSANPKLMRDVLKRMLTAKIGAKAAQKYLQENKAEVERMAQKLGDSMPLGDLLKLADSNSTSADHSAAFDKFKEAIKGTPLAEQLKDTSFDEYAATEKPIDQGFSDRIASTSTEELEKEPKFDDEVVETIPATDPASAPSVAPQLPLLASNQTPTPEASTPTTQPTTTENSEPTPKAPSKKQPDGVAKVSSPTLSAKGASHVGDSKLEPIPDGGSKPAYTSSSEPAKIASAKPDLDDSGSAAAQSGYSDKDGAAPSSPSASPSSGSGGQSVAAPKRDLASVIDGIANSPILNGGIAVNVPGGSTGDSCPVLKASNPNELLSRLAFLSGRAQKMSSDTAWDFLEEVKPDTSNIKTPVAKDLAALRDGGSAMCGRGPEGMEAFKTWTRLHQQYLGSDARMGVGYINPNASAAVFAQYREYVCNAIKRAALNNQDLQMPGISGTLHVSTYLGMSQTTNGKKVIRENCSDAQLKARYQQLARLYLGMIKAVSSCEPKNAGAVLDNPEALNQVLGSANLFADSSDGSSLTERIYSMDATVRFALGNRPANSAASNAGYASQIPSAVPEFNLSSASFENAGINNCRTAQSLVGMMRNALVAANKNPFDPNVNGNRIPQRVETSVMATLIPSSGAHSSPTQGDDSHVSTNVSGKVLTE